ncbi:MAG: hypothetical protein ABII71_05375 [Candidatus Micrarchaeota archaeon]
MKRSRKKTPKVSKKITKRKRSSRKGELELGEVFVVLLMLVGVLAGSMYLGNQQLHSIQEDDRTIGDLLEGGLIEIGDSFLDEVVSGNYDVTAYRWMIGKKDDVPDEVPLGSEGRMTADILFNGGYIDSVRGLAFKIYAPTDDSPDPKTRIRFYGVFLNYTTPMDQWLEDDTEFTVDYFPYPMDRRFMEGCHVQSSGMYRTADDTVFKTYFFECSVVWQGSRPSTINAFED